MKFNKPPLTLPAQLGKMKSRGLLVTDESFAEKALQRIGYYRLSAYALPFQQCQIPNKPFLAGTSLDQIIDLYEFDRELRALVLSGLERVEIVIRSVLNNHMCTVYGSHWFMDPAVFSGSFDHGDMMKRIEKELQIDPTTGAPKNPHAEVFINHYYSKYGDPDLPPAWMIFETVSLGTLSMIYSKLRSGSDRQKVADYFSYNEAILSEWLHTLAYVRNICAHHLRLWNRKLVIKSRIPNKHVLRIQKPSSDRFYAVAVIIYEMLVAAEPTTRWNHKLAALFAQFPVASKTNMGFPIPWTKDPFWNLQPGPPDPACLI